MANAKLIDWTNEGYKLYAMKDGYICSFTMGTSESIEKEIQYKGTRNYDYWLVEKDGVIDFYVTKINPLAQGIGIEVNLVKSIEGSIVEDYAISGDETPFEEFFAFINFKIVESESFNNEDVENMIDWVKSTVENYNELEDDELLNEIYNASFTYDTELNEHERNNLSEKILKEIRS